MWAANETGRVSWRGSGAGPGDERQMADKVGVPGEMGRKAGCIRGYRMAEGTGPWSHG